ncbi:EAL domain-containing protein [Yersinia aldovae]|uniref:cyclic-guanylate-specific phosphodiesterase n=1 Tax=Yersinia aldovae TaxID=29483 RepID=UPI0005DB64AD|nr:cyclic-guanylate-specific phosphodiesterase [Yersinia aldovae]CNH30758.1 EAL domain-containing protein [Yersinia aldovae]
MATKLMMTNRVSSLLAPSFAAMDRSKGQNFWRQCQRQYTFQPIYRTSGVLLAIELLTAVFHPSSPDTRLSPEDYFNAISIRARLDVVLEQLKMVKQWHQIFVHHSVLVSINIDGQALMAMQDDIEAKRLIDAMPYIRFELLEHVDTSSDTPFARIAEADRLWLDDFGSGLANFTSFLSWRYEYIKVARDLFIVLQESEVGNQLFFTLITLMDRYSKGVIVEGVETSQEWAMVQRSDAAAAQGYYLSRPTSFDRLQALPMLFCG